MRAFFKNFNRDLKFALGLGGVVKADTMLTARLFRPLVPPDGFASREQWLEYLKAHPVSRFPELWQEDKRGRRQVKHRVVTTAFVNFVVDQLQAETSVFGDFKYHDSGTGTVDEAAGDTGLGTPCGEARDAGTQVEGASANIYKSVATHTYAGTFAITEHGLFNAASGVTLMDRTKFAAINVVSGNQIEFTFQITFSAGG